MKLLLADDEAYSRESILSIVPWSTLDITQVICAENGEEGLTKALEIHPEIILTDIRMPRLNGVEMCTKIRENFPDCFIIFMSAYSDKEYLKSAILLSAVNYLEKPFTKDEITATIKIAVEKCKKSILEYNTSAQMKYNLNISMRALKNLVVITMLRYGFRTREFTEQLNMAYPNLCIEGRWLTMLISIIKHGNGSSDNLQLKSLNELLDNKLRISNISKLLIGEKDENTIVIHISLKNADCSKIRFEQIRNISKIIFDILKNSCDFILAVGSVADTFDDIYKSYQAASISLQRSFYHTYNTVIYYNNINSKKEYIFKDSFITLFHKALLNHNKDAADSLIHKLTEELRHYDGTLISVTKNYYIMLLKQVYEYASLYSVPGFSDNNIEIIWDFSFLTDVENYIHKQLQQLFTFFEINSSQNVLAYKIKNYIDKNYFKTDLSLCTISEVFGVSQSYICVIFKRTFKETVNKYIINLRLEQSKEYLSKSDKRIKEISSMVGYPDTSYYIKLFKKTNGLTPSDYRFQ